MTSKATTTRNRANAAKSTGPRSAGGKAVVAQNARRHGATARPDPERVAIWARIILDAPDLGPNDLFANDIRIQCALALAVSEVRLAEATRALAEFEAGVAPPSDEEESLQDQVMEIDAMLTEMPMAARHRRTGIALLSRLQTAQSGETRPGGRHHRLLKRYWREARAQRKRAFRDWLACVQEQEALRSGPDKKTRNPKQSQISTLR